MLPLEKVLGSPRSSPTPPEVPTEGSADAAQQEEPPLESLPERTPADLEFSRLRFREFVYQESAGPHQTLARLHELCRQWLRPEACSKEEILEMLVLEQFLGILPDRVRPWVVAQYPESCKKAASLVEGLTDVLEEPGMLLCSPAGSSSLLSDGVYERHFDPLLFPTGLGSPGRDPEDIPLPPDAPLPCLLPFWPDVEPMLVDQGDAGEEKTEEAKTELKPKSFPEELLHSRESEHPDLAEENLQSYKKLLLWGFQFAEPGAASRLEAEELPLTEELPGGNLPGSGEQQESKGNICKEDSMCETTTEGLAGDVPAIEGLGGDAPSAEGLGGDVSAMEGLGGDVSAMEGLGGDVSATEGHGGDVSMTEGLGGDVPATERLTGDVPTIEGITGDIPPKDQIAGDIPTTESLGGDVPAMEGPGGDVPVMEQPSGDVPVTKAIAGDIPMTEVIAGDIPVMEALTGDVPVMEGVAGDIPAMEGVAGDVPAMEGLVGDVPTLEGLAGDVPVTEGLAGDVPAMEGLVGDVLAMKGLAGDVPANKSLDTAQEEKEQPQEIPDAPDEDSGCVKPSEKHSVFQEPALENDEASPATPQPGVGTKRPHPEDEGEQVPEHASGESSHQPSEETVGDTGGHDPGLVAEQDPGTSAADCPAAEEPEAYHWKLYTCSECGEAFAWISPFMDHHWRHISKRHACQGC